jgi:hypothetical protein
LVGLRVAGQGLSINAKELPLNKVLVTLRDQYGLQFSFDDQLLAKEIVSCNGHFDTPQKALNFLLANRPLAYMMSGEVFVIYKQALPLVVAPKEFVIKGKILDAETASGLPFANVQVNGRGTTSDQDGNFIFRSTQDSLFRLRIAYLGYYQKDTVIRQGTSYVFQLYASDYYIDEVVVKAAIVERSMQTGTAAGLLRLNQYVAKRLPGFGDDAVLNLLRLQPGIMAAGENSESMVVWGSAAGQSEVLFDGYTLWGLKNFNENISAVNPYLAKEVQVLKGGYNARFGDKVGAFVHIVGEEGDWKKPQLELSVNNMTVNALASTPVGKTAVVMAAYRQTFYNIYDKILLSSNISKNNRTTTANNIYVDPDYTFRDLNLKFSTRNTHNDQTVVSLLWANDAFDYSVNENNAKTKLATTYAETNRQRGISLVSSKQWTEFFSSRFTLSYSDLARSINNSQTLTEQKTPHGMNDNITFSKAEDTQNETGESKIWFENQYVANERHRYEFGLGFMSSFSTLGQQSATRPNIADSQNISRIGIYAQDIYSLSTKTELTAGVRIFYPKTLGSLYWQPRVSLNHKWTETLQSNLAWGVYQQYLMQASVLDDHGNYEYQWIVSNKRRIPVLNAQHFVANLNYSRGGFLAQIEGYYKFTNGLVRVLSTPETRLEYIGKGRNYGVDFLVKQDYRGHTAWVSYSLCKSEENFSYFPSTAYQNAPFDQRHEFKIAAIVKMGSFYLSANYVYGSGFPFLKPADSQEDSLYYSRLDAGISYKYTSRRFKIEAGVSVLNVFNHENIKYANYTRIPSDLNNTINIHAESVPFTPTLFLNIGL